MQRRASAFSGYAIEATDGHVGVVDDILFEDDTWNLRWFVINTGSWLAGRKILIHPSSLERPDIRERAFPMMLTMAKVEASPDISSDEPVSGQMDRDLNTSYGQNPSWGDSFYGTATWSGGSQTASRPGNPHLRSLFEVMGYHIHALDGDIGHFADFLVDDETWKIEYAVVDTKNWGFGKHVLVAPADIKDINWADRYFRIDLTRYRIKSGSSWKEPDFSDQPKNLPFRNPA